MSKIIKDEETGEDVEVYTADEIEQQKQEAIDQYKTDNPDKTTELADVQEKLKTAEEKLSKTDDKDKNFSALRKAKEDAEKKVEDILKGVDEKITTVKKEVLEGVMKDHYNDTLKALAGDDEELAKKIEFNYKRLADPAATKSEMNAKFQDAYRLSVSAEDANALTSSVISSGSIGKLNIKSTDKKFTAEEKAMAQKLAAAGGMKLEDKDFK